jgi:hypothetical protein
MQMNVINTHTPRYLMHTVGLDGLMVAPATTRLLEDMNAPSSL